MLRTRTAITASLAALSVLALAACSSTDGSSSGGGDDSGPIVVGFADATTGWMGPYDDGPRKAFELKVDEINDAGGINGRQVEIISGDNQTDPTKSKQVAADLISQGADLIVGSCNYDIGSPAGTEAQNNGLLGLTACAGSPRWGVEGIGPLAYNAANADYAEGAALAELATTNKWSKPYVLVDTTLDYDKEVCQGFKDYWVDQLGNEIAGESQFQNSDTSISSQISDIKASGADSIMFCSYNPGGATAVRNLRAGSVDLPIMSGNGMSGSYWVDAVPGLSDFYTTINACLYGDDPDPKVNDFVAAYKAKYNEDPADADTGLILGYVLAEVVLDAIQQSDGATDGETLAGKLDQMTDFDSLLPTTYTPEVHINTERPFRITQYTDGKVSCLPDTVQATKPVDLHLG